MTINPKQNNQSVMWACPICILPMLYLTDFADGSVHRYMCKICKRKYDISHVTERRDC